jgi:CheY-like chemotaxis protein
MEKPVKILVVEDEEEIRNLVVEFLELNDYKVIVAKNGSEGITRFKQHDVDIIVTDVDMPMMGGLEMATEIRKMGFSGLIIFGTATKIEDFQQPFLVLRKPFSFGLLLKQITRYLQ